MLNDIAKSRCNFVSDNYQIVFGQSRLAINGENCKYCGMCLNGCPYNIIYSPRELLNDLIIKDKIEYKPKIILNSFYEKK